MSDNKELREQEHKKLSYKVLELRDTVHSVCSVINMSGLINDPGLLRTNWPWSMTYYELLNEVNELESILNDFNKKVNEYKVSANLPIFQAIDLEVNMESNNER